MRSVINYFIKNPLAANLIMFGILIMGYVGFTNMKSTFFPEVESRNIFIRIVYPGASPQEIEEGIVNKIEENLKGVTGVERYTSVSSENAGSVTVEVFKSYNTDLVLQDVKNAVDQISSFPVGMEPPIIYKQENLGFAISFALSGPSDLATLKRYGRKVEEELLAIEGISKVELSGFPEEEIEIAFREKDLRAYQLTFAQAAGAVRATNLEITGGTIKGEKEELLLRAKNKAYYAEGLRDIVVKTNTDGSVVLLHQVADISDKWADNPNRSYLNGQQSVVVTVQNTLEEDMLSITEVVNQYIQDFNEQNTEVKATLIRDGSVLLRQRMDLLTENGIMGFCIVVLLLAMFLHWRLAFWVAISIPISFAGMFILTDYLGITINVISLFGMIIVVGILVDDGIVIAENIYQKYEEGVPRLKAALDGTTEVLPAVFAAVLTTIIAFSSFLFIEGQLGDFFSQMAVVVILSLSFSLVEGVIILPSHVAHSKALSPDRKPNRLQQGLDRMMYWMSQKMYAPLLKATVQNKFLTVAIFVGLLLLTFGAIGGSIIQSTFFPIVERDDIDINIQMPAGTSETITISRLDHVEAAAWRANEILSKRFFNNEKQAILRVEKNIGPTTYQGKLSVALLDGENRDSLSLREVTNTIREQAGYMPDIEVITYGQRSNFGKPISVSLVGDNYEELQAATAHIKKEMLQLEELADVVDNNQEGLREVNIELKEKALYLGLNVQEILTQVRNGFFGNEVQRLQRGRDEVRVWARYAEADRADITQLENMRIRFQDGREFPLSEIATLSIKRGIININHIDGKKEIKIESDVSRDDVSVSDITSSLRNDIIPAILADYPSVTALFEGQNREQEKSIKSMQTVGAIMLALMFFIIALTFRSVGQTVVVFLLIPFAMIGVGWGHWLMDAPISLFSALGIIALVGILVNDSLVFVSAYNALIKSGKPQMEAILEAGGSRFRPILLTSLTTFAGLMPLLFEKSLQAKFLIPMAISVSFGLLVITVVNLVLLPVLLIVLNRAKVYASYAWNGIKPNYEDVEVGLRRESGYEFLWYVILTVIGLMAVLSFMM